jgi:hypothetical protein
MAINFKSNRWRTPRALDVFIDCRKSAKTSSELFRVFPLEVFTLHDENKSILAPAAVTQTTTKHGGEFNC